MDPRATGDPVGPIGVPGANTSTAKQSMHRVTLQDAFGTQLGDHNVQNFYLPTLSAQWPLRLGMIPPSASCFQRRAVLDAVDQMLPDVSEATTSRPPKVLSGLGGVGKTQVAVRYVEQQWARRALDL